MVYHVAATDAYGCGVDTATVTITINNPPLGINEAEDAPVKVYPNPVDGVLNVAAESIVSVDMFNAKGQKVFVSEAHANHLAIDTEAIAPGLYYLRVATAEGVETKAVVVK